MPAEGKLLDWPAFAARHFPLSRRHDFGVVKAYEAYRKGLPAEERIRPGGKPRSGGQVEVWEGEGGAVRESAQETTRNGDGSLG